MNHDLAILHHLPNVKIWGDSLDEAEDLKSYRGKFVVTADGKFFAKLVPTADWDSVSFFHDTMVKDLGVKDPESMDVKDVIVGGGKIEIKLDDDHAECRLHGKSTVYGDYDPMAIDTESITTELEEVMDLGDRVVEVIPDHEP